MSRFQYYDPLERTAARIADELDWGNTYAAADMMRDELYYNRNPRAQKRLVDLVDYFDRKGRGADLQVRQFESGCSIYGAVSVVGREPGFFNMPPWVRPPQFIRQSVGTVYLGEDPYCYQNRRYW